MSDTTKRDAVLAVMEEFRMTWVQQSAPGVTCIIAGHDGYAMVAEITRLRAENIALAAAVELVRALHYRTPSYDYDEDAFYCKECGADFPCPTLRALEEMP